MGSFARCLDLTRRGLTTAPSSREGRPSGPSPNFGGPMEISLCSSSSQTESRMSQRIMTLGITPRLSLGSLMGSIPRRRAKPRSITQTNQPPRLCASSNTNFVSPASLKTTAARPSPGRTTPTQPLCRYSGITRQQPTGSYGYTALRLEMTWVCGRLSMGWDRKRWQLETVS